MAGKVFITGDKKLDRKLRTLGKETPKLVRRVLRAEAKTIQKEIKGDMPKQTGHMKKQVKVKSGKRSRRFVRSNVVAWMADKDRWYMQLLEFGTKHIKAMGIWRKVFDTNKKQVTKRIRSNIWKAIHDLAKSK